MTVRALLKGGLGNQLFIAAAAGAQAARLNCSFGLVSDFDSQTRHAFFQLGDFGLVAEPEPPGSFRLQRPLRFRSRLTPNGRLARNRFRESGFAYDPAIEHVRRRCLLDGYFQSERYFRGISDQVASWFERVQFRSRSAAEITKQITPNSIAIHLRMGDYTNSQTRAFHGILSKHYWMDAVARLADLPSHAKPKFFLFSDDAGGAISYLDWVKFDVVVPNLPASETLKLLGQMPALAMSNSSFSWWGGWQITRAGGDVVAPERWFMDEEIPLQDLYLPTWIKVSDPRFNQDF